MRIHATSPHSMEWSPRGLAALPVTPARRGNLLEHKAARPPPNFSQESLLHRIYRHPLPLYKPLTEKANQTGYRSSDSQHFTTPAAVLFQSGVQRRLNGMI